MNIIANAHLPEGAICISYADDILIVAPTHAKMQNPLQVIGDTFNNIGLIISTSKTEAVTICWDRTDFTINNENKSWVDYYKYLGVLCFWESGQN